jgi:hypothetical protein
MRGLTCEVSTEINMESRRFDNISDNLRRLFSTPSLMQGEDPEVYAELYNLLEEAVQPQNIFDQLTVVDITSHVREAFGALAGRSSTPNDARPWKGFFIERLGLTTSTPKPLRTLTSESQGSTKRRSPIIPHMCKFQIRAPASLT